MSRLALLAASFLLLVSACSRASAESGSWVKCSCEYLTDRDGEGAVEVEVCAGDDPARLARSCAEAEGVGMIGDCSCRRIEESRCESVGACAEGPGARL